MTESVCRRDERTESVVDVNKEIQNGLTLNINAFLA